MFNLKEFIVKNIVNGIKNGTFSKEYGNIMAVNYLVKGILTEEDVASIDAQISTWEAEQAAKEDVKVEPPTEEITESTKEVMEEPKEDTGDTTEPPVEETEPETEQTETESAETETEITETESESEEIEPEAKEPEQTVTE